MRTEGESAVPPHFAAPYGGDALSTPAGRLADWGCAVTGAPEPVYSPHAAVFFGCVLPATFGRARLWRLSVDDRVFPVSLRAAYSSGSGTSIFKVWLDYMGSG